MKNAGEVTASTDDRLEDLAEIADAVGLGQIAAEAHVEVASGHVVVVVAAGDDGADFGVELAEGFRQYCHTPYPKAPVLQRLLGDRVRKA